ncbi:hypothetical protein JQS43_11515 [Natronosporangium hydrolyticum]|uniref:Uncharacterized protein n=1 Tax=Natronosporangium hydrolyticum TaxID=2811111 RepID=A0A895YH19_9ACTN|nr:hypothetical protein [Natronosporangium hydrolyticum]QSB16851.1 hypothetical protein JQS43_11515 [Natronosporangium hydrolyticum]
MAHTGYVISQTVFALPALIVLVAGLALLTARRRTVGPRATGLAIAGAAVLLAGAVVNVVWASSLPWVLQATTSTGGYAMMSAGVGILTAILHATGIGLLIAAVLTRTPASQAGIAQLDPPVRVSG